MRRALGTAAAAAALLIAGVGTLGAQTPGPNTWTIDSGHSTAGFSVKHLMVSTVRGTFGPIKGTIEYDGKSLETLKVDAWIDVSAINTGNESRDRDLRGAGFFDVTKFPAASFRSRRVEAGGAGTFRMIGDLTMHGITKEVTLTVEGPSPTVKGQNGGQKIGASATTTLNRRDFGLEYSNMVEAVPVVSDEVQVTLDIEANKRG